MPLPPDTCVQLDIDLSAFLDLSVDLPGGMTIAAQLKPGEFPSLSAIVGSLLEPLNAALTPLAPFFRLLDVVIAVVNCVMAIPDSLGPPPDPTKLVKCVTKLVKALAKLTSLFPPLSIPVMIVGICKVIVAALLALIGELEAQITFSARIETGRAKATQLALNPDVAVGAAMLMVSMDCAQADLDLAAQVGATSLGPLNKFMDLLTLFLELIGLPPLVKINATGSAADMLAPLNAAVEALGAVCSSIPV